VPLFRVLLVNYRPGYRTRLRRRLQELTKLPQEQIILWLSRMPFALSKGVDSETAKRVRKSVTEAGGIVRIETETPIQESLTEKRRANVVFRPRTSQWEDDSSDSLFRKERSVEPADGFEEPPVVRLPDGYHAQPPPLDEVETREGLLVMHPPARFAAGSPAVCSLGDYGFQPPVLPDLSREGLPQVLVLHPPEAPSTDPPPVVGTREHASWADEPAPEIVLFFPPRAGIDLSRLLPPVLVDETESSTDLFGHGDMNGPGSGDSIDGPSAQVIEEQAVETMEASLKKALGGSLYGSSVRLFLCRPAPEDEDTVAEALREVMGVSMRESWDLLRKAPTLLREYSDHTSAILTIHQLESRGVTVSLNRRGKMETSRSGAEGRDLRTWLTRNG
jgi:hypothetical protein